jgi:hypothetical protein
MQWIDALEVQVSAIDHVEGTRLAHKQVEDADIVELAIADMGEGGIAPLRSSSVCSFTAAWA